MTNEDIKKNIRYVQTPPGETLDINNVGLDQADLFGDTIFPAKLAKCGEVFADNFVNDYGNAFKGLAQAMIFTGLTLTAFFYLPQTVPFVIVAMVLAFIAGIGFATFRIWMYVYHVLDRPTAALKQAGGDGWFALSRQSKQFQKDMKERFPPKGTDVG